MHSMLASKQKTVDDVNHPEDDAILQVPVAEVSKTFKRVNACKAAGPDGIPSRLLKTCAKQLSHVYTDIFNLSLKLCHVPQCFKNTTIVPIPKKSTATFLNDYRPIALMSVVMKCFEKLVVAYNNSCPWTPYNLHTNTTDQWMTPSHSPCILP